MKKLLVILALCLPALLAAQMTYVPDDNFEQYLILIGLDTPPLNDSVPTKNIDTLTYLWVAHIGIWDLTGIEDFTALTKLYCENNNLKSLDVSKNIALTVLWCGGNILKNLDVSKNSKLKELVCELNSIKNLDVSNNSALEFLYCGNNNLTSLDVSKNSKLRELHCGANDLSILDLTFNPSLIELSCSKNSLISLDLSRNTYLTELRCSNNNLTSLDISNHTWLWRLYCENNYLTSLDVTGAEDLKTFRCSYNKLTGLDVSKNSVLSVFDCENNPHLYCIQVADTTKIVNKSVWKKDSHAVWSEDCSLVSVEEETNPGNDIIISPNPAVDYVEVSGVLGDVKVYDVLGIEHPATSWHPSEEGNVKINVSQFNPGVYFVRIGSYFAKFVKI